MINGLQVGNVIYMGENKYLLVNQIENKIFMLPHELLNELYPSFQRWDNSKGCNF